MSNDVFLLTAVQLGDSALPTGRFVHSFGLEAWLRAHPDADAAALTDLIAGTLTEGVAPLDGVAVAHAHRARSLAELVDVDQVVTSRKLVAPLRHASESCGRRLAGMAATLSDDPLLQDFWRAIRRGETAGHLAVVSGVTARALGLDGRAAVLLELRGSVVGMLSAAVRLGRLGPFEAQRILLRLSPTIAQAAEEAASMSLDEMHSTAPEMEVSALAHRRLDANLFMT